MNPVGLLEKIPDVFGCSDFEGVSSILDQIPKGFFYSIGELPESFRKLELSTAPQALKKRIIEIFRIVQTQQHDDFSIENRSTKRHHPSSETKASSLPAVAEPSSGTSRQDIIQVPHYLLDRIKDNHLLAHLHKALKQLNSMQLEAINDPRFRGQIEPVYGCDLIYLIELAKLQTVDEFKESLRITKESRKKILERRQAIRRKLEAAREHLHETKKILQEAEEQLKTTEENLEEARKSVHDAQKLFQTVKKNLEDHRALLAKTPIHNFSDHLATVIFVPAKHREKLLTDSAEKRHELLSVLERLKQLKPAQRATVMAQADSLGSIPFHCAVELSILLPMPLAARAAKEIKYLNSFCAILSDIPVKQRTALLMCAAALPIYNEMTESDHTESDHTQFLRKQLPLL